MKSEQIFRKWSGITLLAAIFCFILHLVTPSIFRIDSEAIILIFLYGFLLIPAAIMMRMTSSEKDSGLARLETIGLVGHGLFVLIVCSLIIAQFRLQEEVGPVDGTEAETLRVVSRSIRLIMDQVRAAAFILLSVGSVAMAVRIGRSEAFKNVKWLRTLGIVVGTLSFIVVFVSFFSIPDSSIVEIGNMVAMMTLLIYLSVFGVVLIKSARSRISQIAPDSL